LFVAQQALALGRGGISRLAKLTGMSRPTIAKRAAELRGRRLPIPATAGRIRRAGSGRWRVEDVQPAIRHHLTRILAETTAGDPMSLLKWTSKSARTIAAELTRLGHPISWRTVARCLHDMGYSLQANIKTIEGPSIRIAMRSFATSTPGPRRSSDRRPGHLGRPQEEGIDRRLSECGADVAATGDAAAGLRARLPAPRDRQGDSVRDV
jgi:hypothetical protein